MGKFKIEKNGLYVYSALCPFIDKTLGSRCVVERVKEGIVRATWVGDGSSRLTISRDDFEKHFTEFYSYDFDKEPVLPFKSKEAAAKWIAYNMPIGIRSTRPTKTTFISAFSSNRALDLVINHLAEKLYELGLEGLKKTKK